MQRHICYVIINIIFASTLYFHPLSLPTQTFALPKGSLNNEMNNNNLIYVSAYVKNISFSEPFIRNNWRYVVSIIM